MEGAPTYDHRFEVVEADIDYLGHASNIAYVRWIQDAAVAHSEAVGLDLEAYRRIGAVFVVVRHEIDYLRPVLRGDRLTARTWIPTAMAAKCLRNTDITRERDGVVVSRSVTTWGFIDVTNGRPRRISEEVRDAFYGRKIASPDARKMTMTKTPEDEAAAHDAVWWDEVEEATELLHEERFDDALLALRAVAMKDPRNPYVYYFLGIGLFEVGEMEPARDAYRACLKLAPTHLGARVALCHVLRQLGDLRGALREGLAALAQAPGDSDVLHAIGLAYYARGDKASAKKYLDAFLASKPEFEVATEVRAMLASLEGEN